MEASEKNIGEKARAIATALGERRKYDKFYFVGDDNSISDMNYATDNVEEWAKKTGALSIEYSITRNKESAVEQARIRAKCFWFLKRTLYCERNGKVSCNNLGAWEDRINDLYRLASRREEWKENIAQLKKELRIA